MDKRVRELLEESAALIEHADNVLQDARLNVMKARILRAQLHAKYKNKLPQSPPDTPTSGR